MTAPAAPTKFSGSITALATPFQAGRLDEAGLRRLVDWQIANGTDGLVPCGTTGESPTLSHDEHKRVVALTIEAAAGRVPVIAGTGSNNTAEAIDLTRHAKEVGADAALVVTPYYNKPTQSGLIAHFTAIARAVDLPIIIYNIPPRSVIDMTVETMAELAKLPQIVGVKDATADLVRPLKTQAAIGPDFAMLSGEDATALPFLVQGGHGCISVTANVAPALCAAMHDAWREGDIAGACGINRKLLGVHDAMFCETNPAPVKYGLSLLGIGDGSCRLPLAPLSQASKGRVEAAMRSAGLVG